VNKTYNNENQPRERLDNQPLPEHIHDDNNGLDYTLVDGAYYLPNLLPPDDEEYTPGIWGRRYLIYLKEYRPSLLTGLRSGNLSAHLRRIEESAEAMYENLVARMGESDGLTNQLKLDDQMAWVRLTNSIRHRAEEIVKAEIIYR